MKYDIAYYYNLLRMYSSTASQICKIRWDFVAEVNAHTVLDYGSGCGFFKAFAPEHIEVDTYDIMPVPTTGITRNVYDLVCFWDVLEHIPDFNEIIDVFRMAKYVAITVPIKPESMAWEEFKHYKPLEHIHHFTHDSLKALMNSLDFEFVKCGDPECPPRQYIFSFLFKAKHAPRETYIY